MITVFWTGRIANKKHIEGISEQYLCESCPDITHDVDVVIEVHTELDDQLSGYCYGDNEAIQIHLARASYGEPYSYNELLRNLMHELIHAKQLILDEIAHDDPRHDNTEYMSLPWEKEAYLHESSLCEVYFKKFLTL